MTHSHTVGIVTLVAPRTFTVYSETASRTDEVRCEPQTVELRWVEGHGLCATFAGLVIATTWPTHAIGDPMPSHVQWSDAGFDPEALHHAGFDVTLTRGTVEDVGVYSERCGAQSGRPIRVYRTGRVEAVRDAVVEGA